ncbi:MAG TPA: DMT family transporter [Bryobacteraceae bacterium]|nr:DMT family transporter [Bryobacteraceae bacterium]
MWNALLLSVITAAYYLLLRRMSADVSPFLLGTMFRVVCLLLFSISFAVRGHGRLLISKEVRRLLPWLLLIAACNFIIEGATIVGLGLTTALNAALLARIDIVFAIGIGMTFFHERPHKADLFGIALLAAGCFAVLNVHLGGISGHAVGDLLVVLAGFLIATNAFVIRYKLGALHKDVIAFHNVLYSTIPFALACLWETRVFVVTPATVSFILILGAVVFGSYMSYYAALRAMPVWRIRALLLTVPALVLFGGAFFLRDPVTIGQIRGAALVVAGELILLVSAMRNARAQAALPGEPRDQRADVLPPQETAAGDF